MRSKKMTGFAAAAFVAVFCGSALAEDMVDNPEYATWSKQKPGATIKYKITSVTGNMTSTMESTTVLKEVTAEKAVVEMTTKVTAAGMDKPMENTMKRDVLAKIAKKDLPENNPTYKELGKGTEDVKVGDKTYKCEWKEVEVTMEAGGQKFVTKSKMWNSSDLPGIMIKSTSEMAGQMASKSEMILVEYKAGS